MNPLVFWIILVVVIAGLHLYFIRVLYKSPNKPFWLALRIILATLIGFLDYSLGIRPIELLIVAYLFSGWFLHDIIIAVGMGRKPWYLNGTGPMDKAQASIGHPAAFILKGIAFIGSVGMYFWNY